MYLLTIGEARRKIEEHRTGVERVLKKPLVQAHYLDIFHAAINFMENSPEFGRHPKGNLRPMTGEQESYMYYDLGHALILERIARQLVERNILSSERIEQFKTIFGKFYSKQPAKGVNAMCKAFDQFVIEVGEKKAEQILRETHLAVENNLAQVKDAYLNLNREEQAKVVDLFHNPAIHRVFHFRGFQEARDAGKNYVDSYRAGLEHGLSLAAANPIPTYKEDKKPPAPPTYVAQE